MTDWEFLSGLKCIVTIPGIEKATWELGCHSSDARPKIAYIQMTKVPLSKILCVCKPLCEIS